MSIKDIEVSKLDSSSNRLDLFAEVTIPGITDIESINVIPEVDESKISYEIDQETGKISIFLEDVIYTSRKEKRVTLPYLRDEQDFENNVTLCYYWFDGYSDVQTVGLLGVCPPESVVYVDSYDFIYQVTIEYYLSVKSGEVKLQTKDLAIALPVYDPDVGMEDKNQLRTFLGSEIACFELVGINEANASPVRVMTAKGVKAIAKQEG